MKRFVLITGLALFVLALARLHPPLMAEAAAAKGESRDINNTSAPQES